ncbi:hypothetical protein DUNSADRAFT_11748, partial [Dunaliella salina]
MWSAGTWALGDSAGPVAEAMEHDEATTIKQHPQQRQWKQPTHEATPIMEAMEHNPAKPTLRASSCVEPIAPGGSVLWDAEVEAGQGARKAASHWGWLARGRRGSWPEEGETSSQASKEWDGSGAYKGKKKYQVWRGAASEVDEDKQKWHNYHVTVRERKARQAGSVSAM